MDWIEMKGGAVVRQNFWGCAFGTAAWWRMRREIDLLQGCVGRIGNVVMGVSIVTL
jgi:hypothetical protein